MGQEEDNILDHPSFKKLLAVVEDLKVKFVELETEHKSEFNTVKKNVRSELIKNDTKIRRMLYTSANQSIQNHPTKILMDVKKTMQRLKLVYVRKVIQICQ